MRIYLYSLLLVLSASCKKSPAGSEIVNPLVTKAPLPSAVVSGTILPADQIAYLDLQFKGDGPQTVIQMTPDNVTGSFRFTQLKGGPYTLTPVFYSKLFARVHYELQLDSAGTVNLDTLNHQPAPVYFQLNNADKWWNTYAAFTPTGFSLISTHTSGRHGDINFSQRKLSIYLKAGTRAGTYEPGVQDSVLINYSENSGNLIPKLLEWSSSYGNAHLTIDKVDTLRKVITGRFSATLKPANAGALNDQVVKDGHFNTTYRPL